MRKRPRWIRATEVFAARVDEMFLTIRRVLRAGSAVEQAQTTEDSARFRQPADIVDDHVAMIPD